MSKEHLGLGPYAFIACGKSGKRGQSKGMICGLSLKDFLKTPEDRQCKLCRAIANKITNRK